MSGMHPFGDAPIVMKGRSIVTVKVRNGWQVVLIEHDRWQLLREIPFDSFVVAKAHGQMFAEMYGAELLGVWE